MTRLPAIALLTAVTLIHLVTPAGIQAARPVDRSAIGMIGDSLTYQDGLGEAALTARFRDLGYRDVRVNGSGGRTLTADQATAPGSLTLIRRWRESGFRPYTYVIALGTNNINRTPAFWTPRLRRVMEAIGPGHRVLWVDTGFRRKDDPRTHAFNANLTRFAAATPGLAVVRWNAYIHRRPQDGLWEAGNDIHMTSAGYALRNAYVARMVEGLHQGRVSRAPADAPRIRQRPWTCPALRLGAPGAARRCAGSSAADGTSL